MQPGIETFVGGTFGQNAYIVREPEAPAAVAIDPGERAEAMADYLAAEGLWLEAILLTHAHLDHVEGVGALVARTGASTYLHPADRPLYDALPLQAARFGMQRDAPPPIDAPLADEQELRFGGLLLRVLHVPGHSPGHVILHMPDPAVAFVGDVVFLGSIGRTDLPGGDFQTLMQGIRERVLTLPEDTRLYCGHGPPTSVAHEARTNPFLIPLVGGPSA